MHESRHNSTEVIVVGAGANGLAVAHALRQRAIPVRIVDQASRAADAWYHRHPQLRLNTHRKLSQLPGMPLPRDGAPFPSRDDIIRYLDEYARRLEVPIDYGVTVTRIRQSAGGWSLETADGSYSARHVVVATGHDRIPFIPDWPGRDGFTGKLIHAADFGDVASYRRQKLLVVGAGNSGSDILNHLATIDSDRLWVSVRTGSVVFPRRLFGVPVQRLSPFMARLPAALVDTILNLTEWLAFGNLKKWGLPKPPQGGATRLLTQGISPAIDDGFIAALKSGRIEVVPEIRQFHDAAVELANGDRVEPDVVIAATGYHSGLVSLLDVPGLLNDRGIPVIHGKQQLAACPGLWFSGMRPRLPGFFYMACNTSREIATAIAATVEIVAETGFDSLARTSTDAMQA
jgi:cation diffusion facilitator CzcD-associated flavoprotein CzcO